MTFIYFYNYIFYDIELGDNFVKKYSYQSFSQYYAYNNYLQYIVMSVYCVRL